MPDTGDTEKQQEFDRVKLAAYHDVWQAQKEASATNAPFKVTQNWVASTLNRSIRWVKKYWNQDITPDNALTKTREGRPSDALTNQQKILAKRFAKNKRKRGTRKTAR